MTAERGRSDRPNGVGKGAGLYIAQVAEMLGVSAAMVRQWEKHGLVRPARTASGFRVYNEADLDRLSRVRDLVRSGVNWAGIKLTLGPDHERVASPPAENETALGMRLQRLRRSNDLSLRQLASATDLSASHISALERSMTHPSVAVLQRLAAALGTNMVALLGGHAMPSQLVVKPDERRPLDAQLQGVEIQQLFRVETVLESLLFIVDPGAGSGESYQHAGEEFLFMIDGTLDLVLDERDEYTLEVGDSMTFVSHRPHRFTNKGEKKATVLWVNTPPTF